MSDATLLIYGCAVTFTAAAGVYVALRSGFNRGGAKRRRVAPAAGPSATRQANHARQGNVA